MNKWLTNKELIEQLQKLNPEAVVVINIKQHNKVWGKQLCIRNAPASGNRQTWIDSSHGGCAITVHLPEKAIFSNWPKDE